MFLLSQFFVTYHILDPKFFFYIRIGKNAIKCGFYVFKLKLLNRQNVELCKNQKKAHKMLLTYY